MASRRPCDFRLQAEYGAERVHGRVERLVRPGDFFFLVSCYCSCSTPSRARTHMYTHSTIGTMLA